MRNPTIAVSITAALVLAACDATPTAAPAAGPLDVLDVSARSTAAADRVEFEGFIHFCESDPFEDIRLTPGGTLHLREGINRNRWITDSPLVTGEETNVVSGNINFHNPEAGVGQLEITIAPDGVDGTWEARAHLHDPGPEGVLRGVGHGTGDLLGKSIEFSTPPGVAQVENVCSDVFDVKSVSGVVVSTAAAE